MSKTFDMWFSTNGQEDCREITLRVQSCLPCKESLIPFGFTCEQQYAAQLLVRHLDVALRDALRLVRRRAYERGWKDAKAKRRKKQKFASCWRPDIVSW